MGAMAGVPSRRGRGAPPADDRANPSREVWGKPDELPTAPRGGRGGGGGGGGGGAPPGQYGNGDEGGEEEEAAPKEKADFGLSGALAGDEATGNVLNGVVLKFTEPADARPPPARGRKWRFYVFKVGGGVKQSCRGTTSHHSGNICRAKISFKPCPLLSPPLPRLFQGRGAGGDAARHQAVRLPHWPRKGPAHLSTSSIFLVVCGGAVGASALLVLRTSLS